MTAEKLAQTDVLIWWGHAAHGDVADEVVERVCNAVWSGMGAIFLHSAHFAKPFKRLMGSPCNLTWREAGERERIWLTSRSHPIAAGLPDHFELENEEMYGEPFGVPLTAHFLGGCVIAPSPAEGVVDEYLRVYGQPGLHIFDGSTLSANPGVNPSLTITAQAEWAAASWPHCSSPNS